MKRAGWTPFVAVMVMVGVFEVILHWLLGKGIFPGLLARYLFTEQPSGKHFFAGTVDNTIPAAALGCVNGWLGFTRWPTRTLIATTLGIAAFVAALVPAYGAVMAQQHFAIVWGSPQNVLQAELFHLYDFFTAFLTAGAFTYGACAFRRDWKHHSTSPSRQAMR